MKSKSNSSDKRQIILQNFNIFDEKEEISVSAGNAYLVPTV